MTDTSNEVGAAMPTKATHKPRFDLVFAKTGDTMAQDGVTENLTTGELVGMYSGNTVDEMKERGFQIMDAEQFVKDAEAALTTDPVPITEAEWWEKLECLPPCDWCRGNGTQSFYMSEFYSGDVTSFYVKINDTYFTFRAALGSGDNRMDHYKRLSKVLGWLQSGVKVTETLPDPDSSHGGWLAKGTAGGKEWQVRCDNEDAAKALGELYP